MFETLQKNLAAKGLYGGAIDGLTGPKTYSGLIQAIGAHIDPVRLPELTQAFSLRLAQGHIDTALRLSHFIAQCAHESGGFHYWYELGGPDYFKKYDGRKDLGNTYLGDGYRFRGRGIIQLTGRSNYSKYAAALGLDLIGNPELAATTDVAVRIAVQFWNDHGLSALADKDDVLTITKRINGGTRGLAERKAYLVKMKSLFGI